MLFLAISLYPIPVWLKKVIPVILLMITIGQARCALAQYPFEIKPPIHYKEYSKWKAIEHSETKTDYNITIPDCFTGRQALGIKIAPDNDRDSCIFRLYKNGKPLGRFIAPFAISPRMEGNNPKAVFVEDVNGDGLKDLKIVLPFYGGCGGFNFYAEIVYLFQQPNGRFNAFCFSDWMDDESFPNRPERDFDGDHNFEIVTKTFQNYGKHNYELYNIYNFQDGKLVNVNTKADYPLLIQLLWKGNYKTTNKVSKPQVRKLAKPLPDDFNQLSIKWL